jgi:hypothetical protein
MHNNGDFVDLIPLYLQTCHELLIPHRSEFPNYLSNDLQNFTVGNNTVRNRSKYTVNQYWYRTRKVCCYSVVITFDERNKYVRHRPNKKLGIFFKFWSFNYFNANIPLERMDNIKKHFIQTSGWM